MVEVNWPNFKRNLKLEEFYRQKTREFVFKKSHIGRKLSFSNKFLITVLFVISIGIVTTGYLVQQNQDIRKKAASENLEAQLALYPKIVDTSLGSEIVIYPKVNGPAEKPVAFVLLSLKFDPQHLKYQKIGQFDPDNTLFPLKLTNVNEANNTGVVNIVYGLYSKDKLKPGVLNMPGIVFTVSKETESTVSIIKENSQVIFSTEENALLQTTEGALNVSSVISPTPAPSIALSVTTAPTVTISPTSVQIPPTNTPTATSTVAPSQTPIPETSTPTLSPTTVPTDVPSPSPTIIPIESAAQTFTPTPTPTLTP